MQQKPLVKIRVIRGSADRLTVTLFNASDAPQSAVIRSALLTVQRVWQCDLSGQPERELPVVNQPVEVTVETRRLLTLKMAATFTK
jgi:hypothetical protein